MDWEQQEVRDLKENHYVIIDDEPCKIKNMDTSKPGKHGEAKARIDAVGIFDGKRHDMLNPVSAKVRTPIIDRRKGQVVNKADGEVNIMDMDSYETFQIEIDEETYEELEQGQEIRYLETMDRRKITQT
ncbi:MAG: translation initiation factor IF-5A [Candidatus Thermoplasmatota archaeon]